MVFHRQRHLRCLLESSPQHNPYKRHKAVYLDRQPRTKHCKKNTKKTRHSIQDRESAFAPLSGEDDNLPEKPGCNVRINASVSLKNDSNQGCCCANRRTSATLVGPRRPYFPGHVLHSERTSFKRAKKRKHDIHIRRCTTTTQKKTANVKTRVSVGRKGLHRTGTRLNGPASSCHHDRPDAGAPAADERAP